MSKRRFLSTLLLASTLTAPAQNQREQVELLVMDGSYAIFCSEGFASGKQEAVEHAQQAVLRRLLYDGVEGFNWGSPIVTHGQGTNLWLNDFFSGKTPAYKNFVNGVEVVGEFDQTPTGETHCRANVEVRWEQLVQQTKVQGVSGQPQEQQQPAPEEQKKKPKRSFL